MIILTDIHRVKRGVGSEKRFSCSFKGIGVDNVIESLEANDSERNALLSDLWEND